MQKVEQAIARPLFLIIRKKKPSKRPETPSNWRIFFMYIKKLSEELLRCTNFALFWKTTLKSKHYYQHHTPTTIIKIKTISNFHISFHHLPFGMHSSKLAFACSDVSWWLIQNIKTFKKLLFKIIMLVLIQNRQSNWRSTVKYYYCHLKLSN